MGSFSHGEDSKMKSFWTNFVVGAFVVLLLGLGVKSALGEKSEAAHEKPAAAALPPGGLEQLAAKLNDKEKSLQDKELRLADWESRLKIQEERIKSRVEELRVLTDAQKKHAEEMAKRRKDIEDRMLVTFESMNPKKSAEVLSVMEEDLAVEILLTMKAKKVAAVMDKMDSSKAMSLQTKIAERRPASEKAAK
jgi:flagellar motility protein MotE (MotC chaperone)